MARDVIRLMQALFLPAARAVRRRRLASRADVYRTRDGWLVKSTWPASGPRT